MIDAWSSTLQGTFADVWLGVVGFVPQLVLAVVIFVVGWAVGSLLGRVVSHIVGALKVDSLLQSARVDDVLKRGGFSLDSGRFVGGLVEWFVIVVFLVASLEVLGLTQVNAFLQQVVLLYLPRVIVAVLILLVAVVIAAAMQRVVVGAARAADIRSANFLGSVTKWSIWVFAVLMALFQLGIAAPFVQTLFTGVVVALSIAFGLAFGLGGQDAAGSFLSKVRSEIKNHN
jgi:small-conductance mechanosensitive channel